MVSHLSLILTLIVSYGDAAKPMRPALSPYTEGLDKPVEQEGRRLRSDVDTVHPESGRRLKLKYDGMLADGVTAMSIDDMQEVLRVSCGESSIQLEVDTVGNTQNLMQKLQRVSSKLVLTGRAGWGCSSGHLGSILHHVIRVEYGATSTSIRLETTEAQLEELFEDLNLSMVAPLMAAKPQADSDMPASVDSESVAEEPNSVYEENSANLEEDGDQNARSRKLWGSRRRRRWFHVPAFVKQAAAKVSHAVADVAKRAADDVKAVVNDAKRVVNEAVKVAKDISGAIAGDLTATTNVPIPSVNSIRWNADASDNVIKTFKFGSSAGGPTCDECLFYVHADVHLQIVVSGYKLQLLECLLQGKTEGKISITGTTAAGFHYDKLVDTIKLPDITFTIGMIPVTLKFTIPVNIGADATFTGATDNDVYDFKAWAGGSITQGLKVDSTGKHHVNDVEYSYGYNIQGVPPNGAMVVEAYVMPAIAMSVTLIGGPITLSEKIALQATAYGSGSSSATCPTGSDYLTTALVLTTLLTPGININLAGISVYKKVWPANVIYQESKPLLSGCVVMSYERSGNRRLKVSDPGTNKGKVIESKLSHKMSPIGTGTTFSAIIKPVQSATSACKPSEYPLIRMNCVLHTEIDPHDKNLQESISKETLQFGCTQHREFTRISPNVTASGNKVHDTEFYQMKYVLESGVLKPLVSSQYCESNPLNTTPYTVVYNATYNYTTSQSDNRSEPCYIFAKVSNASNLPKIIGDLTFKAALAADGMTLSSDGSTTSCFNLPIKMIRHTDSLSGSYAKCDSYFCTKTSAPINKGASTTCPGDIEKCSESLCCKASKAGEVTIAQVAMRMELKGMKYSQVKENAAVHSAIITKIKEVVVAKLGKTVALDNVDVTLAPGSIHAIIKITPPSGTTAASLKEKAMQAKANIASEAATKVQGISNVASVTTSGDVSSISVVASDPVETTSIATATTATTTANSTENMETDTDNAFSMSKMLALIISMLWAAIPVLAI